MRNAICSSALIVLLLLSANAKSKIPAELNQATYVALGYETTSGFVSENDLDARSILSQDREALDNVRQALGKWKKYIVTTNPDVAQILIAVRSGRIASADGGIRVHGSFSPGEPPKAAIPVTKASKMVTKHSAASGRPLSS